MIAEPQFNSSSTLRKDHWTKEELTQRPIAPALKLNNSVIGYGQISGAWQNSIENQLNKPRLREKTDIKASVSLYKRTVNWKRIKFSKKTLENNWKCPSFLFVSKLL